MNSNRTYTKAIIKEINKQVTYEVVQIGKNQYIRNNEACCVELALTNAISYANKIIVLLNFY